MGVVQQVTQHRYRRRYIRRRMRALQRAPSPHRHRPVIGFCPHHPSHRPPPAQQLHFYQRERQVGEKDRVNEGVDLIARLHDIT
eukprot:5013576-Pleurochrysis_carterae.AAC.1